MPIEIGVKNRVEEEVTYERTAASLGSGGQQVYATPAMVALMEACCLRSLWPFLEPGQETVGTKLEIEHVSATPMGMKVYAESEIIEVDRKRIVFAVKAYDEAGLIGQGTHERFIIQVEKFMAKCQAKKNQ